MLDYAPGRRNPAVKSARSRGTGASKGVDKKQIEAHAHYAQALIHDLDDEPALALKEFSAAAALDPSNEELVLELTRRYLLLKQPEQALEVLTKATAVPGRPGSCSRGWRRFICSWGNTTRQSRPRKQPSNARRVRWQAIRTCM